MADGCTQNTRSSRLLYNKWFFQNNTEILSSYDLTLDYSLIIVMVRTTVIYRNAPPWLHNIKINWDTYREILQDRTNLSVRLQDDIGLDKETSNIISLLHQAAK
jgi:hypothetical protein